MIKKLIGRILKCFIFDKGCDHDYMLVFRQRMVNAIEIDITKNLYFDLEGRLCKKCDHSYIRLCGKE